MRPPARKRRRNSDFGRNRCENACSGVEMTPERRSRTHLLRERALRREICPGTGGEQKHRLPHPETGGKETEAFFAVLKNSARQYYLAELCFEFYCLLFNVLFVLLQNDMYSTTFIFLCQYFF